jgi:ssDNA-binding Zn-finger/Zn-ribbon topoisomerase 1
LPKTELEQWIYENVTPVERRCPHCGSTWPGFNPDAQSVTFNNEPDESIDRCPACDAEGDHFCPKAGGWIGSNPYENEPVEGW